MTLEANGFRITVVCMDCTSTNVDIEYGDDGSTTFVKCNKCDQIAELT